MRSTYLAFGVGTLFGLGVGVFSMALAVCLGDRPITYRPSFDRRPSAGLVDPVQRATWTNPIHRVDTTPEPPLLSAD